ncbi:TnsA endonuclease N-terminal domain-containing protein [Acinetobacter sp. ANC 4636]
MGFKPNIRKIITIQSDVIDQINEAFNSAPSLSNQYVGVRNIHQGAFGKRTAIFPSLKCNGAIAVESQLELGHVIELERSPSVLSYRSQAIKINLDSYTFAFPDFLIQKINKSYEIHEVKESLSRLNDSQIEKLYLIKAYLKRKHITYKLYDKNLIPDQKQRQNLLWLYLNSRDVKMTSQEIQFAQSIYIPNIISFSSINSFLSQYNISIEQVNFLLFYKLIGTDRFPEINILEQHT